jgi:hypothetical protein
VSLDREAAQSIVEHGCANWAQFLRDNLGIVPLYYEALGVVTGNPAQFASEAGKTPEPWPTIMIDESKGLRI